MAEERLITIILAGHFRFLSSQCPNSQEEENEIFRESSASAVGLLMYAMIYTRPDLAYAVSTVSQFMLNIGRRHWDAIKWVFRYLREITELSMVFHKLEKAKRKILQGYVDTNYAGDLD